MKFKSSLIVRNYTIQMPEFQFETGQKIYEPEAHVAMFGNDPEQAEDIHVVLHGMTDSAKLQESWSEILELYDLERSTVVAINALGSCFGTVGPASIQPGRNTIYGISFPAFTIRDQARFFEGVLDYFHFDTIRSLLAPSIGAMQGLELLLLNPNRYKKATLIAPGAFSENAASLSSMQIELLERHHFTADSLQLTRNLLRRFASNMMDPTALQELLFHRTQIINSLIMPSSVEPATPFDPVAYYRILQACAGFKFPQERVAELGRSYKGKIELYSLENDPVISVESVATLAEGLREAGADVEHRTFAAAGGHMAWLLDATSFVRFLRA